MPSSPTPAKASRPRRSRSSAATSDANQAAAPSACKEPAAENRVFQLRGILFDSIEREVRDGNVRVILWLADRLKLLDMAETEASPASELRAMLDDLNPSELREFAGLAGTG